MREKLSAEFAGIARWFAWMAETSPAMTDGEAASCPASCDGLSWDDLYEQYAHG
jgi:hypothetical protein